MNKITVEQMLLANQVLKKISQKPFPGKVAFVIGRVLQRLNKEADLFETTRMEVISRYADKDENGELVLTNGNIHIPNENIKKCNEELKDLLASEITLYYVYNTIKIEWLEDVDFTPEEAAALEPFIDFE